MIEDVKADKLAAMYPSFNPNYFIHAANILLLVAYSVSDVLWLRLFAVAASLISLPYFVLQSTPQWPPIAWSVVFAAINSFQSWRLYLERRPVKLTPDEEEVRRLAFAQLPPRKVLQLVSLGAWTSAAPGERLIEHGTTVGTVALIVGGKVHISKDGRVISELGAGDIVGSALVLSGVPADVDAVTVELIRMILASSRGQDVISADQNLFNLRTFLLKSIATQANKTATARNSNAFISTL